MAQAKWYAVHTVTGHEKKVARDILQRADSLDLNKEVLETFIPMHDVTKYEGGKKVIKSERKIPGYVLVKMIMNDATWECVRRTPSVIRFVSGQEEKALPLPLSRREADLLLGLVEEEAKPKERTEPVAEVGTSVVITEGPFEGMMGSIVEHNSLTGKCIVMCSIFGRETPIEVPEGILRKL